MTEGEILDLFLAETCQEPPPTPDEERALFATLATGGPQAHEARQSLITRNTRLVVSIAKNYYMGRGMPFLDLIQEGIIGLIKAIDTFDPGRGTCLSTHATWQIRHHITRALGNRSHTLRLPAHRCGQVRRLHQAEEKLYQKLQRKPTLRELADATGMDCKNIVHLQVMSSTPSLEEIFCDGDLSFADTLADDGPTVPDAVEEGQLRDDLIAATADIPDARSQNILIRHYGLDDNGGCMLAELAPGLDVSRERVRQLRNEGLEHIRKSPGAVNLASYL